MKRTLSVTRERRIQGAPADVWEIIANPDMQERLDKRCRVASTSEDWRSAGAEFVLVVRGAHLRYVVAEAEPGVRWVANVHRGRKRVAVQRGELQSDGTATVLRWTVTMPAGPLTRRLAKWNCERELPPWLVAVEREVLNNVR